MATSLNDAPKLATVVTPSVMVGQQPRSGVDVLAEAATPFFQVQMLDKIVLVQANSVVDKEKTTSMYIIF